MDGDPKEATLAGLACACWQVRQVHEALPVKRPRSRPALLQLLLSFHLLFCPERDALRIASLWSPHFARGTSALSPPPFWLAALPAVLLGPVSRARAPTKNHESSRSSTSDAVRKFMEGAATQGTLVAPKLGELPQNDYPDLAAPPGLQTHSSEFSRRSTHTCPVHADRVRTRNMHTNDEAFGQWRMSESILQSRLVLRWYDFAECQKDPVLQRAKTPPFSEKSTTPMQSLLCS